MAAKVLWPSWRYHEDCPEGKVFEAEAEVPEGWVDHPAKFGAGEATPKKRGRPSAKKDETEELDF